MHVRRLTLMSLEDQARHMVHSFPVIHEQQTLQVVVPTRHSHDIIQSLTTTPRSRQNFATVSRPAQQLPSWGRVSKRFPEPAKRGFGVARRVSGQRESPNRLSPPCAQNRHRSSSIFPILQVSLSKNPYTNSERYAASRSFYRNRVYFRALFWI